MIKITGGVDINKLLDDVDPGAEGRGAAGLLEVQDSSRACPRSSRRRSASRSPTRSRTRRWRSTPARTTRSCAGWSCPSASLRPRIRALRTGRPTSSSTTPSPTSTRTAQKISEPSGASRSRSWPRKLRQPRPRWPGGRQLLRLRLRRPGEQREPREVLQVRDRRRQRHRQGAQMRRPARRPVVRGQP